MADILPNQPIIFNEVLDCHLLDSNIKLFAQYGDITQFQMGLDPCLSDNNLIENGNFASSSDWTLGSGWTISGGQACHAVGTFGTMTQVTPVTDGTLVRLRFTLEVASNGCLVQYGAYLENFFNSGTYERWIYTDTAAVFSFAANASAAVCVSNLSLMTINTNFEVYITDVETSSIVDTLTVADGYFNFNDGYFTGSIDWETLGITDGCYSLGVFDPCPCSQGGIIALDFTTSINQWSLASSWSILAGTATYNGSTTGQALISHVLCDDTTYTVTYTISGMGGNEEFNIRLGTVNGTTRTSDGTYSEDITSDGTGFIMIGNSTSGTQTFDVTDMSIEIADKEATYTSNTIYVSSTDFGCKTYSLALCNDSDGLGFGFESTGFRPNMRVEASLSRGQKLGTRDAYEYADGFKRTTYARTRIGRELGVDLPSHAIYFSYLFPDADHFYIDDVEYFVDDDEFPTVSWDDNAHEGGYTLNVSLKTQLIENRRISSASIGCSDEPLTTNFKKPITDEDGVAIIPDGGG